MNKQVLDPMKQREEGSPARQGQKIDGELKGLEGLRTNNSWVSAW